jgi:hypothetical protein
MSRITIVCETCGQHTAGGYVTAPRRVASDDKAPATRRLPEPPRVCTRCGASWAQFQAGDEYLIGLTHVAPGGWSARPQTAPGQV